MIPCGKSELLLFDETPVQTSITSGGWVDFHSISNPTTGGPLDFYVPGTQDEYLDLNDTKLYLQLQVNTTPDDATVAPSNLLLSTLFQDVSISMNDVVIQGGDQLYAYKSMIESVLLFDKGTKETQLRTSGYFPDQSEHMNEAANSGFVERVTWVAGKKQLTLIGPLHLDVMTQPRYILPMVDLKLRMTRSSDKFSLLYYQTTPPVTRAEIVIQKAILYVRKVKTLPSVVEGHEMGLEHNNAIYPIQHVSMQTMTVAQGLQSYNRENIFQGRMPKFVCVCMVDNTGYNGAYAQNPFNFQHFNISYCALFRDGESIPERSPYEMEDTSAMVRPYLGMIHALEQYNRSENNGLTLGEYINGSTFFVFNLTPDLVVGGGCQQAYRSGNLRLELKFRSALASTINVIVYGVFDGKIEVTKDRNIHLDYI